MEWLTGLASIEAALLRATKCWAPCISRASHRDSSIMCLPDDVLLSILAVLEQEHPAHAIAAAATSCTRFSRLSRESRAVRAWAASYNGLRLVPRRGASTLSCVELPLWGEESGEGSRGFDMSCDLRAAAASPPLLMLGDWVGLLPVNERPRQPAPCLRLLGAGPSHVAARVRALPSMSGLGPWATRDPTHWCSCRLSYRRESAEDPGRCEWRCDGRLVARAELREPIVLLDGVWWVAPAWGDEKPAACDFAHLRIAHWAESPLAKPLIAHWPLERVGAGSCAGGGTADVSPSEREAFLPEVHCRLDGSTRGAAQWIPQAPRGAPTGSHRRHAARVGMR